METCSCSKSGGRLTTFLEHQRYVYYQNIIRNIQNNEQAGLIIPSAYDDVSKQPMFKFSLMGVAGSGSKNYNTNEIIQRFNNQILIALFADILQLGTQQVGSFALSGSKINIMAMAIDYRLKEIQDVLNKDLIPQLFELNGWEETDYPKFVYSDLQDRDMAELAKAIQQVAAVGLIEIDRPTLNVIREEILKVPPKPEDEPIDKTNLTNYQSGASEGMEKGTGNGTGDNVSTRDNSAANLANK